MLTAELLHAPCRSRCLYFIAQALPTFSHTLQLYHYQMLLLLELGPQQEQRRPSHPFCSFSISKALVQLSSLLKPQLWQALQPLLSPRQQQVAPLPLAQARQLLAPLQQANHCF